MDIEYDEIQKCISKSREMVNYILCDREKYASQLSEYIKEIATLITKIIVSYSKENMQAYKDDVDFWNELFRRLLLTINGMDVIAISDVILYEFIESLSQYCNLVNLIKE